MRIANNTPVLCCMIFIIASTRWMVGVADDAALNGDEIRQLLTGNTAVGRWVDHNYRQYFAADGSTIYAQENTRSSLGRWRVNSNTDQYESWWERVGWGSGYTITLLDGKYYWVSGSDLPPQGFEILPGQQLLFDK